MVARKSEFPYILVAMTLGTQHFILFEFLTKATEMRNIVSEKSQQTCTNPTPGIALFVYPLLKSKHQKGRFEVTFL